VIIVGLLVFGNGWRVLWPGVVSKSTSPRIRWMAHLGRRSSASN